MKLSFGLGLLVKYHSEEVGFHEKMLSNFDQNLWVNWPWFH